HVLVRIEQRWTFTEVRRAALALAREVERRMPEQATSAWWKEQRHGVFIDYNQNARDRTVASAYSVRPVPDACVCCPVEWDEVPDVDPHDLRLDTVPARVKERGDPSAELDRSAGSLEARPDLAERDEPEGPADRLDAERPREPRDREARPRRHPAALVAANGQVERAVAPQPLNALAGHEEPGRARVGATAAARRSSAAAGRGRLRARRDGV